MSRDASVAIVAGLILVAAVVAVGVGLSATTKTVSNSGSFQGGAIPDPPTDGSFGVIHERQSTPGLTILGIHFHSDTYTVQVAFVAPPECLDVTDSGQETLLSAGECEDLPVQGEVVGNGITPDGASLTIVRIEVTEQCFEAITLGEAWPPPGVEECAPSPGA
jgi:hypothetical protein